MSKSGISQRARFTWSERSMENSMQNSKCVNNILIKNLDDRKAAIKSERSKEMLLVDILADAKGFPLNEVKWIAKRLVLRDARSIDLSSSFSFNRIPPNSKGWDLYSDDVDGGNEKLRIPFKKCQRFFIFRIGKFLSAECSSATRVLQHRQQ